jgi:hypothetical protein
MLTLEDFVSQLVSRGSPNARVVFDNGSREHCGQKKLLSEIGMWKEFLERHRYCRMPKVKGAK